VLFKLFLATNNRGKVLEYKSLLKDVPVEIVTPGEMGIVTEVDETGKTMEENARLKATAFARESKLVALADDSGLEVDALNGEPGLYSARYAGVGSSDKDRIEYLLGRLKSVPPQQRTAVFRCIIAVATPGGKVELCSGECHGLIVSEPRGSLGFGYDPIFYLPELHKTMAELPLVEKNKISHRGKASRQIPRMLAKLGII
jgi:XTP/dITP diphosphohydrolase